MKIYVMINNNFELKLKLKKRKEYKLYTSQ